MSNINTIHLIARKYISLEMFATKHLQTHKEKKISNVDYSIRIKRVLLSLMTQSGYITLLMHFELFIQPFLQ